MKEKIFETNPYLGLLFFIFFLQHHHRNPPSSPTIFPKPQPSHLIFLWRSSAARKSRENISQNKRQKLEKLPPQASSDAYNHATCFSLNPSDGSQKIKKSKIEAIIQRHKTDSSDRSRGQGQINAIQQFKHIPIESFLPSADPAGFNST